MMYQLIDLIWSRPARPQSPHHILQRLAHLTDDIIRLYLVGKRIHPNLTSDAHLSPASGGSL